MSDQSTETLTGSTVTRTSSAELSDNVPSSASSLQHHLKKVYRRSDAEITSIPENVEEGEDAQNLEAVSEEMEVNSEVDRMETEEEVEFETEACDLEARTLAEELVRREMESVDRDVESKRRHVVVDSEQVILAETNSEVDFKRDGEVSPLLSVTDTNFSLTDRSISPPFNNNLLLQQTLPSSPTFDLVDIPVPDRPDIIASHDDYEPLDKTMDDRALSQLSANLLHMLFLLSNDLTATDKRIFCSDLMTLDTLTVFLNHEDVNVVYTAFKLLSRVIEMSSTEDIEAFVNRRGFHLVATQLNKVIASDKLVNICALLVNGQSCSAMCKDEFSNPFILPLIGILEKCCHDLTLCSKAFSLLFQIFEERVSSLGYAVRNGFVQVLSNCLMALNDHHPYMDSDDMDNLLAYMHTFLQKIANYVVIYGKNESKTDQIKSLLCPFMLLERRERREQRGSYAVSRVETAISLIYQELYTSIKQEAMARPLALLQRILSRGSIPEPNRGLEDSANFSIKRISLGGGNQSLTASMTSLHHLATDSGDSKNTKNSLAEMLLCTLKDFFCYSLYRVSSAKKCSETLTSVVELLVDTLIVQEDSGVKKSLWTSIVESEKLRATVWKLLTEMITFMLSPSCDQISAESIIAVFGLLPDTSQKKIVDNLTPNDFLLPNLRRFLQVNFLKDVSESFLRRILNKRSAFLLRSTSAPTLPVPEKTESNIQSLWLTSYMRDRKIWKRQLAERKQRVIKATERLVKDLRNAAMEVNRDVVNRQNMQRKRFIELMKIHIATEVSVRKQWQRIIEQFTHERAVWTDPSRFPQSWEMDPTEGPGRVRKRLQRCHLLNIAPKFLLGEYKYKLELPKSGPPLQFLFEELRQNESASADVICRLHTNETINFTCKCSNVTPSTEIHGELLISDDCIHFVGDDAISDYSKTVFSERQELLFIRWPCNEIKCFYKRRYQLQDNALEIFLTSGRASLFAVDSTKERDVLWDTLNKLPLPNLTSSADLDSIQKQWLSGHMSNFDYLTHLNTLAGRSFNDLMQYPVFPFVLNNYDSSFLDIDDPENYRKLNKPIASQLPENEAKFKQHYEAIEADIERSKRFPDSSHISLAPYHYASHYSNSGVVLHYLIRLLPYSHMFLKYQDGQFDIPDRTFHSMQTSWLLSSERSSTDVKELIPEFFYLPEFLVNYEGFDFGKRQNKAQVNDLNLPDWCKQDNRLFVMVLRQALENSIVTSNLQNWINLIFGYQQQGEAARAAVNKFHPATYYGLEVNSIEDELQQSAIKVMIRTYGQMPKQLFTSKHPEQLPQLTQEHRLGFDIPVLDTVAGLKWGDYLGSPADAVEPKVIVNELMGAQRVVAITTEEVFSLGSSSSVITHETKSGGELSSKTDSLWAARLTWNHPDNVLRLQTQKNKQSINFLSLPYKVTACSSLTDSGLLFIASVSGIIQVHRIQYSKQKLCELAWVGLEVTLIGHRSPITSLVVCKEYSIVVSADESGLCIIWDLNKLSYVRCIQNETKSRIDCVAVSPTLGDIAFCSPHGSGSVLEVFTVNAQPVARLTLTHTIAWLCYSAAPEGLSVNALVGALSDATIQFWSSWDLKPIRTLSVNGMDEPFICCTFTPDNQRLAANTDKGRIIVWDKPRVGMQGIVRCLPAD
ncbi:lysosomal-trafficking regulator-like isoform X2 [Watersipora subatra]|uniref:lysosomal-trafficking regulator-like isoform X2 n=1 Tax=Watersipora subatra TaxID=2589382 RepID=UPI00355B9894